MTARTRLDLALVKRGLAPTRARARDAIARGTVTLNGATATRPSQPVADADRLSIDDPAAAYVARSALKLKAGLSAAQMAVAGKVCLDLGASTGGFTQVLLEAGAARVYAVDVGHDQLNTDIAARPEVVMLEGTNARDLTPALIPDAIDLLVCDVSFVSLLKVLEAPLSLCAPGAEAVLLIKPQFEVGRAHIGKGGIVSPGPHIEDAVARIVAFMEARGWTKVVRIDSPISGGDGNTEHVAAFSKKAL